MPKGLVIVTSINALLLLGFSAYLIGVFYAGETVRTINFVSSWIAVAGLLASLIGTFFASPFWHRIARGSIYAMLLGFGLQIFGLITQVTELDVIATAFGLVLLILYLVGARGYLNSEQARAWFKVNG